MGIGETVKHMFEREPDNSDRNEETTSRHDSSSSAPREHISGDRASFEKGGGVIDQTHASGHRKKDVMPSGDTTEETRQLKPVTHEHVRHLETEEIERIKDRDRHIHHVQHHTQPVTASEELEERQQEYTHPVTRIEEQHVNKNEERGLFEGQVHQARDSLQHSGKERTILDKGTKVKEQSHHHIHNVVQPVIEKETVDRARIHTTIPIKEVTQEAPIIHQSQAHAPVTLERFVQGGGSLQGGISQDEIGRKVLQTGECTREVDGNAEELADKLHLGQHTREREGDNLDRKKPSSVVDPLPPAVGRN